MENKFTEAQERAKQFVAELPSDTILRNLAFWLDLAVNKGHYLDILEAESQKQKDADNELSKPDKDTE